MCKYLESSPTERGHRKERTRPISFTRDARRSLRSRGEILAFPLGAFRYLFSDFLVISGQLTITNKKKAFCPFGPRITSEEVWDANMKISTQSSVPVYTISGSSTARPLPEWLARRRKRSLKNDPEYANRVELLQDFEFEEASQCIRISEDGQWVMSTGMLPAWDYFSY